MHFTRIFPAANWISQQGVLYEGGHLLAISSHLDLAQRLSHHQANALEVPLKYHISLKKNRKKNLQTIFARSSSSVNKWRLKFKNTLWPNGIKNCPVSVASHHFFTQHFLQSKPKKNIIGGIEKERESDSNTVSISRAAAAADGVAASVKDDIDKWK